MRHPALAAPSRGASWGLATRGRSAAVGVLLVAVSALLAGCAGLGAPRPAAIPWADALFEPADEAIDAAQVMALSPPMRRYLAESLAPVARAAPTVRAQALLQALYAPGELKLEYDAQRTRNAAEAFDARRGNCLSLVLMTAVFAQELGLDVQFNEARLVEPWQRVGDFVQRSGHVNLTLTGRLGMGWQPSGVPSALTVDFLPADELRGLRTRPIGTARVLSMYHNNRAAESLAEGRVAQAYWFTRAALAQDPGHAAALNTLGVVYLRAGQEALAGQVFEQLLAADADDVPALRNLALVRRAQGRLNEAETLQARADTLELPLPGEALVRAEAALQRGDRPAARRLLALEARQRGLRADQWLALAQAWWRVGDAAQAEHALQRALAGARGTADEQRLSGKLAWLREQARTLH